MLPNMASKRSRSQANKPFGDYDDGDDAFYAELERFLDSRTKSAKRGEELEEWIEPKTETEAEQRAREEIARARADLSALLLETRLRAHHTQSTLAKIVGCSQSAISDIENLTHAASLGTLVKIALAIGVPLEIRLGNLKMSVPRNRDFASIERGD